MTRKQKIGTKVVVLAEPGSRAQDSPATVIKHGRASWGTYTEVEYADGRREQVHREYLLPVAAERGA